MEDAGVMGSARDRGGIRSGVGNHSGNSGPRRSGAKRIEAVDDSDGRDLLDGTRIGTPGVAMEPSGIGMGGLRSDRIGSAKTGGGGFAFWECRNTDGFTAVLWSDSDSVAEGNAVWQSHDLSSVCLETDRELNLSRWLRELCV